MMWSMERAALLGTLDRWLLMLGVYSQSRYPTTIRDQQLERILLMWHATATAREKSALHTSESCFNNYLPHFVRIVESAERFQDVAASCPEADFTFEMGVLPPLFFTALKCRFPGLRQRTIDTMDRAPRKEGLWDREELLAVSKKILDLELGDSLNTNSTVPVRPQVFNVKVG